MFEGHVKQEHPAANPRETLQTVSRLVMIGLLGGGVGSMKLIFTYFVNPMSLVQSHHKLNNI